METFAVTYYELYVMPVNWQNLMTTPYWVTVVKSLVEWLTCLARPLFIETWQLETSWFQMMRSARSAIYSYVNIQHNSWLLYFSGYSYSIKFIITKATCYKNVASFLKNSFHRNETNSHKKQCKQKETKMNTLML